VRRRGSITLLRNSIYGFFSSSPTLPSSFPPSFLLFLSIGLQGGGDITDYVLFFKTPDAQEAMKGGCQLAVGVSGGIAAGPVGRSGVWQYHWRLDTCDVG